MGNVVELSKYRKKEEPIPQVSAAHNTVEFMRSQMYSLPSNQSRMEYAMMIIAQLTLWIIKSDHYDKPVEVIKTYVAKKCSDYSKKRSGE
jgi:hypothetical protein